MSGTRTRRLALVAGTALLVISGLAACVGEQPMPVPTASETPSPGPTSVKPEAAPVLRPEGNAAANKQYFDFTNETLFDAKGQSDGKTIVDNLVAAGFVKSEMEVTRDETPTGEGVASIIVSVRVQGECLIGQFMGSEYRGELAPLLGTGACLVGETRPIDW